MNEFKIFLSEINQMRDCGTPILGIKRHDKQAGIGEMAALFGLRNSDDIYNEISLEEASASLTYLLHQDMAYNVEIISLEKARSYTSRFMNLIDPRKTHFYTNRRLGSPHWKPATHATFDSGLLIIQEEDIICIWFKDED